MKFYYNYLLSSQIDDTKYKGCTSDLIARINQHNKGEVESTRHKRPWKLIYYEACLDKNDAYKREKYFKSGGGYRYLTKRLENYFKKIKSV